MSRHWDMVSAMGTADFEFESRYLYDHAVFLCISVNTERISSSLLCASILANSDRSISASSPHGSTQFLPQSLINPLKLNNP
jgi:hypothetical protein